MEDIKIILNKEGTTELLYKGYNIIAKTFYNENLTNKILELITNELKNENNFNTLDEFLTMK